MLQCPLESSIPYVLVANSTYTQSVSKSTTAKLLHFLPSLASPRPLPIPRLISAPSPPPILLRSSPPISGSINPPTDNDNISPSMPNHTLRRIVLLTQIIALGIDLHTRCHSDKIIRRNLIQRSLSDEAHYESGVGASVTLALGHVGSRHQVSRTGHFGEEEEGARHWWRA